MNVKLRTIEVDADTADALATRAAARGLSIREFVAELAARDDTLGLADDDQIAELDRRWASAQEESATPHEEVVRWLETWGTPNFRPWHER